MSATPFTCRIPDAALADLRERLARTRLPDQAPEAPWTYGTDVGYLADLIAYWRDGFDWRAQEAALNAFPQAMVQVGDLAVHCLHAPGRGPEGGPAPRPLLLCHGWPGSVFEFLDIIPRLTDPAAYGGDPAQAFTVVAPSLPGYGFSFRPGQRRLGVEEMADTLAEMMGLLGYDRFLAQGGDWGAFVTTRMAWRYPERIAGLHLNMLPVRRDRTGADPTPEEAAHYERVAHWLKEETGYQWIQGTRPQTLAFALTDSPSGLAAWQVEKFRAWSDCGGTIEAAIPRERMLANIALYWFTGAIGSAAHPYFARMHRPWPIPDGERITVPTGYAAFPKEMVRPPRSLACGMFADIRRWTEMPRGGHFAALEQPALLADDIRAFAAAL
ncbi:epoxide hydrolase family protein [Methylobacterium isbiliense]|uniref:Haloalkane dehalogenase n=1 Tax=Methylobacterium isbiliense TaxID=315478 RepID=A0ABQ4SLB4_9HYPH|nr:epoxide hydrolase family protein [Methylobacterium isbiliense]MDN3626574.1 epoxide hydrolase [Methylobacterium isbiliense]GJE03975.1 Haloalkane dehalogenase [Methylobacterium isbiliense]